MIMMTSGARTEISYGRTAMLAPVSTGFLFFRSILDHTPTARWSSLALWPSTDIEWTNRLDRTLDGMEGHNLPYTDVLMKREKWMPSVKVGRGYDKSNKKSKLYLWQGKWRETQSPETNPSHMIISFAYANQSILLYLPLACCRVMRKNGSQIYYVKTNSSHCLPFSRTEK